MLKTDNDTNSFIICHYLYMWVRYSLKALLIGSKHDNIYLTFYRQICSNSLIRFLACKTYLMQCIWQVIQHISTWIPFDWGYYNRIMVRSNLYLRAYSKQVQIQLHVWTAIVPRPYMSDNNWYRTETLFIILYLRFNFRYDCQHNCSMPNRRNTRL